MAPWPSVAADYQLSLDFDPATGVQLLPHADGTVEFDTYPVFNPITVSTGDRLTLNVSFGGSRIGISDTAPLNQGIEAFTFSLFPYSPSIFASYDTTIDLLGVEGSLNGGSRLFSGPVSASGGIFWQVSRNLTDSAFSFSGATIDLSFTSLAEPTTIDRGLIGAYGGSVSVSSPAPEPESWAMAALGALLVAFVGRRRRRPAVERSRPSSRG